MSRFAIVLAGGSGRRFGDFKQFHLLGEATLLEWSVRAVEPHCAGVVVVVPDKLVAEVPSAVLERVDRVVGGGGDRSASVRAGLAAVPEAATEILVHAASHPLAGPVVVRVVEGLVPGVDAVFPAAPMVDVAKQIDDQGRVVAGFDKAGWVLVQQPIVARADILRRAYAVGDGGEDLEVLATVDAEIVAVEGDPTNLHIATPADLAMAQKLIA